MYRISIINKLKWLGRLYARTVAFYQRNSVRERGDYINIFGDNVSVPVYNDETDSYEDTFVEWHIGTGCLTMRTHRLDSDVDIQEQYLYPNATSTDTKLIDWELFK